MMRAIFPLLLLLASCATMPAPAERKPAAIACQRAVRANHPVTGDDDRDGIGSVCQSDGSYGSRLPDPPGELPIADRLAVRDLTKRRPDAPLKCRTFEGERNVEHPARPVEVLRQLLACTPQRRCVFDGSGWNVNRLAAGHEVQANQLRAASHQQQRPDRALDERVCQCGCHLRLPSTSA